MSHSIYRKRGSGTVRTSLAMAVETQEGLNKIRDAFAHRFPRNQYPTISSVLEVVIAANLQELQDNPEWLKAEIETFTARYANKKGKQYV